MAVYQLSGAVSSSDCGSYPIFNKSSITDIQPRPIIIVPLFYPGCVTKQYHR